jgi:hypothetical protein
MKAHGMLGMASMPMGEDLDYYNFVSEGMIQALYARYAVFPCILDAAIFALKGGGCLK